MRRTIASAVVAAGLLLPTAVFGQSGDGVVVLFNGGVDSVEVFDLTADSPRTPIRLGERRIVPPDIGLVRVADIKVLPDGSFLLADVGGRGAAVATPDGMGFRWVLDEALRFVDVDAATVASYFAPGEPSLVVTGDSSASNVAVRTTSQENTVWFESVRLSVSRGVVPQVAAMPGNMLAIAINWPEIGASGIRIRDIGSGQPMGTSILSAAHVEAPANAVIVPELDVIRDLMVLEDGRMLVTMRFGLAVLAPDGTLEQLVDVGSLPNVAGELASARVLPSGLWAVASFQPGEWVRPHANHRVHWYDPTSSTVVATSEPLSRAPLRVEAQQGHGGTSTEGFDGGLDLIQQGDPETVDLVSLVLPPTTRIGTRLSARATLRNTGTLPVGLTSVAIRGQQGPCGSLEPEFDFARATSVALSPGQDFTWIGDELLDARFAVGEWCAFVQGLDQQGVLHDYGAPVEFTITEASEGTGTTIEVQPLPFGEGASRDMGLDADGDSGFSDVPPEEKGCCATVPTGRTPWWLMIALALFSARPWRRGRVRPESVTDAATRS